MTGSDIRVVAGDCRTEFVDGDRRVQRGRVVALVKPDRTVLVHDAAGYQPVAWLTRPESVTVEADGGAGITARDGGRTLRVTCADAERAAFPASRAGVPVGTCPDCSGGLVRAGGDVACTGCGAEYGLPAGATVREADCEACGLPRMTVERGATFDLCVDYACKSLAAAVRERFDRAFDCPDCGRPLRVRSPDGRVFLGCEGYPECDRSLSLPAGRFAGDCDCDCGLPVVRTATGRRCLDPDCERFEGGDG